MAAKASDRRQHTKVFLKFFLLNSMIIRGAAHKSQCDIKDINTDLISVIYNSRESHP
jgi:hypothetical protein